MNAKATHPRRQRGMAMVLVMIALVVCMILIAGFLGTQGTATGIARNEQNYQECKSLAQSGIDMCVWLMKYRSDWREGMPIGNWLTNQAIGSGTVTVSVADATNSFTDDNTQPVTITSTATYKDRTCTLTAIVGPTGGGTVFGNGSFAGSSTVIANSTVIDSYDSSIAGYNPFSPGNSALLTLNSTANGAVTINDSAAFHGSATFGPGAVLGNVVSVHSGAIGPTSTASATETRSPGNIIPPNTTGLGTRAAINANSSQAISGSAIYPSITVNSTMPVTTLTLSSTATYYVTGNMTINGTLLVKNGCNVVIRVDGNLSITGTITMTGNGQLTFICNNQVTTSSFATINNNSGNTTSAFTIEGLSGCNSVQLANNTNMQGSIFAPQAALLIKDSARLYGGVVVSTLNMQSFGALHWDNALRTKLIHNIYGGSAAPGTTADYNVQYQSN